jgi:hypothetical protein
MYLGIPLANKNCIHKEIENRLNPGNDWYHSILKLLVSHLQSKNIKTETYKTI